MVKKLSRDRLKERFFRISSKQAGGTMRIFGDELNPTIPYKIFLLSINDTAEWIVREMLDKYGLKHEDARKYCLLQMNIPPNDQPVKEIILHDKDRPLDIYLNHSQSHEGSIVFKVIKCPSKYVEIRQRLRENELALDRIQSLAIQGNRGLFIEVYKDGTPLPTPRVFKIQSNLIHVGCDPQFSFDKPYFYIENIDRDHCTVRHENGVVTLIPRGEVRVNGKLILSPLILQHGALICFGRNATFRYCDPPQHQLSTSVHPGNTERVSVYSSLPTLPTKIDERTDRLAPGPPPPRKTIPVRATDSDTRINVLPGILEVPAEAQIPFVYAVFEDYPLTNNQFRLSPAYVLYMALRHRLSLYDKPTLSFRQKQEGLISLLFCIEDTIKRKIEDCHEHGGYLAYWMANTSEMLYFLQQDYQLSKISQDIHERLRMCVERCFHYLLRLVQNEFDKYLVALTDPDDDVERDVPLILDEHSSVRFKLSDTRWILPDSNATDDHDSTMGDILALLSSIMTLLRKCRVNAALTIQFFSHLFHYINTWLFNRIVCWPELNLSSRFWGEKLSFRLKHITDWSERHGLELPSDLHTSQINQLCLLLRSSKQSVNDVELLVSGVSWKINSVQIKQVLNNYVVDSQESPISNNFTQALLTKAHHVDEHARRQGHRIDLIEESRLNLAFVLPEDGYTCEHLRGIPQPLLEFIKPMGQSGMCRLFTNPYSLGYWTEYMGVSQRQMSDEELISLNKKGNALGLRIVSAAGPAQQFHGIYIKEIIAGGAAEEDGRLQPGDQILFVDTISLIDVTQEQATDVLKQRGPSITLRVRKHAATRQGLSALLSRPSDQQQQQQPTRSSDVTDHHSGTSVSSSMVAPQADTDHELRVAHTNLQSHLAASTADHRLIPTRSPSKLTTTSSSYYPVSLVKSLQINTDQQFERSPGQIRQDDLALKQYQSNPNLSYSKPAADHGSRSSVNGPFLIDRHIATAPEMRLREDVSPSRQYRGDRYANRPSVAQQPMRSASTRTKQRPLINGDNISNRLSHENGLSSSDRFISPPREVQWADGYNRRFPHLHDESNGTKLRETSMSSSMYANDEFDERLKRRLEEFEHERELERAHRNRMLAKREIDIQTRVRQDREREARTDRDIQDFKSHRLSEEERVRDAKREQARLLKHILTPNTGALSPSSVRRTQDIERRTDLYSSNGR